MSDQDQFFEALATGMHSKEAADRRNETYEQNVTKLLLKMSGCQSMALAAEAHACKDATGRGFHLDWFHNRFPLFPVRLFAETLPYAHKIGLPELFKGFTKTPIYRTMVERASEADLDPTQDYFGLVFSLPSVSSGMVIHNYPRGCDQLVDSTMDVEHNTRIIRPIGNPVVVYTIEALRDLVHSFPMQWADWQQAA